MKSANSMTRTGKQTTLQGNKTHTCWLPSILQPNWTYSRQTGNKGYAPLSAEQNQKLATSSHWQFSLSIFQNKINLCKQTYFLWCFVKSFSNLEEHAFHVGPLCICCKNQGFWTCFHGSKSCSLQWLVLWDLDDVVFKNVWAALLIVDSSIHRDSLQSLAITPFEIIVSSDSDCGG